MAITPFIFAPFSDPQRNPNSPRCATELSFVKNFDITKPAVMVFFAHGHKATLERDVVRRQAVIQQLEKAGLNAVLVAPQLAYNAKNSGGGRFNERGFADKFFDEAAQKLAQMHDQQKFNQASPSKQALDTFRQMPIMMVSYSGGYGATLAIMEQAMAEKAKKGLNSMVSGTRPDLSLGDRIKGAVLLDTLYGGGETIKQFATQPHRPFVISNYIPTDGENLTMKTNIELQKFFGLRGMLAAGSISESKSIKIYRATGDHPELVENGLTRAFYHVPGFRIPASPVQVATQPDKQPDKHSPARPWYIKLPT